MLLFNILFSNLLFVFSVSGDNKIVECRGRGRQGHVSFRNKPCCTLSKPIDCGRPGDSYIHTITASNMAQPTITNNILPSQLETIDEVLGSSIELPSEQASEIPTTPIVTIIQSETMIYTETMPVILPPKTFIQTALQIDNIVASTETQFQMTTVSQVTSILLTESLILTITDLAISRIAVTETISLFTTLFSTLTKTTLITQFTSVQEEPLTVTQTIPTETVFVTSRVVKTSCLCQQRPLIYYGVGYSPGYGRLSEDYSNDYFVDDEE